MLDLSPFAALPDEARLWLYGARAPLSAAQVAVVGRRLAEFVAGWQAHRQPVHSAFSVVAARFLVLAGHCPTGLSGCGIDASVRVLKQLQAADGIDLLARHLVYYQHGADVVAAPRAEFARLVAAGTVGPETIVFDTTLTALGALRQGGFAVPLARSWHRELAAAS